MNFDDRRLIADTLAGRTSAFGELVVRYQDRLYHSVLRVVDRPEDALDALQDAFVNAYTSLGSFKGDAEFYTWLYRIAFNSAVSLKRRKRQTLSLDAAREGESPIDPVDTGNLPAGADLERREDEAILLAALARLSPEHKQILVMKELDGLKYEDIAEVLGCRSARYGAGFTGRGWS